MTMYKVKRDKKGRIPMPADLLAKYPKQFFLLEKRGDLVLIPIPDDPLKDLQELGKQLSGYSVEDLKRMIEEQAMKEVEPLRRGKGQ